MKQYLKWIFITCLGLLAVSARAQEGKIIDKIIGQVGGEYLMLSDLEEQFDRYNEEQGGKLPPEVRCNILEGMLANALLLNQAKLDSIEVTEDEVESQLTARIDQILSYMQGDVKQFEAYYGQPIAEVKGQFREDLRNQLLVQRIRAKVLEEVSITPREVELYFEQIPKDSLPYFNSEVEVAEIVVKPKVNALQKQVTKEKLEKIRERILAGEKFEDLATKLSDDPGSARAGGDLGWAKRGTFVPEFEAVGYNLEPGQVSQVFESPFGFHIMQLLERRGNSIHCRHILFKPAITSDDLVKARSHLDSVRQLIVKDSMNFSLAVKQFSHKESQSYNNDGNIQNQKSGNNFFEVADLDPSIYFAIDTMSVGQVSSPIEYQDPYSGEKEYKIIKLKSRTNPHKASLLTDYSRIKTAALEAKKAKYIGEWASKKITSTHVTLNKSYESCPNLEGWMNKRP